MLVLQKTLGRLAEAASREEGTRYGLNRIHVLEYQDDQFRLEASDGKKLVIVQGARSVPECWRVNQLMKALEHAPNGTFDYYVPASVWRKAFAAAKEAVVIQAGPDSVALAAADQVFHADIDFGRFPNVDQVLPKDPALKSLAINPAYLMDLCALPVAMGIERITLSFWKPDQPFGFSARTENLLIDAIQVPLT